ncbi:DUF881 domain-containing protein [Actinocatenispora rupis]|uniref:Membrane protein n=1 Tax=Actinocatenispora rupis TaxID=519421 RepID=A0A8J3JAL8_9ACTN|nr:DUF881 domain-containing protein [Actinocatenispora rupis]GID13179.1 membrane protein [Actinocatenispora rupis]
MAESSTPGSEPGLLARFLVPRRRPGRQRGWSVIVPLVVLLAGFLFATTAATARGTQLREDRRVQLGDAIRQRQADVQRAEKQAAGLRGDIERDTGRAARSDDRVRAQQDRGNAEKAAAGLTAVHGPALSVTLDDAPRRPDRQLPAGATADDVVVHQQDVQAVVNALWAGGAEAMSIMDVRVISTSAVRCVGNTLLLSGRVFSPPFRIVAIGDRTAMRAALDAAPAVRAYRAAARDWGLGYEVREERDVRLKAYDGSVALSDARVPQ